MDSINLAFFVELGARLGPLAESKPEEHKVDVWIRGKDVTEYLQPLLEFKALSLQSASAPADSLKISLSQIAEWDNDNEDGTKPLYLETTSDERATITVAARRARDFLTVLFEELKQQHAYVVTEKAAYSTSKLLNSPSSVFPKSTTDRLPVKVYRDIRESTRCLVFDAPTAAGFHMLRVVELVMQSFYEAVMPPPQATAPAYKPLSDQNWGFFISKFRGSIDPDAKKVAELLQVIKDQDRNPIMHPHEFLDEEGALSLFIVSQAAIVAMAARLPEVDWTAVIASLESRSLS